MTAEQFCPKCHISMVRRNRRRLANEGRQAMTWECPRCGMHRS